MNFIYHWATSTLQMYFLRTWPECGVASRGDLTKRPWHRSPLRACPVETVRSPSASPPSSPAARSRRGPRPVSSGPTPRRRRQKPSGGESSRRRFCRPPRRSCRTSHRDTRSGGRAAGEGHASGYHVGARARGVEAGGGRGLGAVGEGRDLVRSVGWNGVAAVELERDLMR